MATLLALIATGQGCQPLVWHFKPRHPRELRSRSILVKSCADGRNSLAHHVRCACGSIENRMGLSVSLKDYEDLLGRLLSSKHVANMRSRKYRHKGMMIFNKTLTLLIPHA